MSCTRIGRLSFGEPNELELVSGHKWAGGSIVKVVGKSGVIGYPWLAEDAE